MKVALEGVDRIRFIVRELLSLSRGDAGGFGPADVREVIESTLSLARVSQIVVDLVLNAIEAMESSDRSTRRSPWAEERAWVSRSRSVSCTSSTARSR